MFPSLRSNDRPFNATSIQKACQAAVQRAGIRTRCTPHTLRHRYATGLLESGVDLLTIQRLLGHSSFSTTLVYLHVRRPHLEATQSPLDWLPVEQCPRMVAPEVPATQSATTPETPSETITETPPETTAETITEPIENVPPSPSGRSSDNMGKTSSPDTDTDCPSTS